MTADTKSLICIMLAGAFGTCVPFIRKVDIASMKYARPIGLTYGLVLLITFVVVGSTTEVPAQPPVQAVAPATQPATQPAESPQPQKHKSDDDYYHGPWSTVGLP